MANRAGYTACHPIARETEDATIADIAVATNSGQIKTGAPSRMTAWRSTTSAPHRGRTGRSGQYPGLAAWFNLKNK